MPISWTDANVLMIGSSTGGETFRFGGRVHGIDRVALPSHRRQSSAPARTRTGQANIVSAEVSVAAQCMVGAGSAAKRAVPRLVWPKWVDAVETATRGRRARHYNTVKVG